MARAAGRWSLHTAGPEPGRSTQYAGRMGKAGADSCEGLILQVHRPATLLVQRLQCFLTGVKVFDDRLGRAAGRGFLLRLLPPETDERPGASRRPVRHRGMSASARKVSLCSEYPLRQARSSNVCHPAAAGCPGKAFSRKVGFRYDVGPAVSCGSTTG